MEASDAWRLLAFGKMRDSHGIASVHFIFWDRPGFGSLALRVHRQIHHRLRLELF